MKEKTRSRCLVSSIVRNTLIVFGFFFLWLNFEDKILDVFDKVQPYLWIKQDCWVTALAILITLLFLVYVAIEVYKFCHNRRKLPFYLTVSLFVLFVMYLRYRIEGRCEFYDNYPIAYLDAYALADIVFAILGLWCCLSIKKPINGGEELIHDEPKTKMTTDKLGYSGFAEKLVEKFSRQKLEKTFSVGVVGSWGAGKTTFMNFLKESLKRGGEFIIVDFNPRNSLNAQNIQEDFFSKLCSALSPYHMGLSSALKKYMRGLQLMESNNVAAIFSFLYRLQDNVIAKRQVETVLESMPMKVAIFIDDLDRLVVEEILEVLKLIDVNANFPNMIFVTAYDKTITNRMLREYLHLGDSSSFIDKFFDYEMILPIRPYRKIFEYLKEEILKRSGYDNEVPKLHEATLDNIEHVISQYLTTMRDAIRFINLFVNDYEEVRNDVDFHDFLLLTILKYKSPEEHRRLYVEKNFLTRSTSRRIYLLNDNDEFKNTCNYKSIMRNLFFEYENNEPKGSYGRIFHIDAFETYFFTIMEGRLSQMEMVSLLSDDDFERVKKTIENWEVKESGSDAQIKLVDTFIDYLSKRNIFKFNTGAEFERYVKVALLVYNKYSDGYNMLIPLFFESNVNDFVVAYGYKLAQDYVSFINVCLREQPYCYTITQKLLLNQIDNVFKDVPIIFSRDELFDITKGYFNHFMKDGSKLDKVHFNVLYSCITDIDAKTRKVTLDPECCKLMRSRIENEPEFYIKGFVRLGMMSSSPMYNSVACEPFWEQIFGEAGTLRQLIYDEKHNNLENIVRVRNFWKLYENNNYTPIQVEGECDVQKEIDNDLKEMVKRLEDLRQREKEFTTLKENYKEDVGLSNKSTLKFYKNNYEYLLSEVKKNKLHLTYAINLRKDLTSEIEKIQLRLLP